MNMDKTFPSGAALSATVSCGRLHARVTVNAGAVTDVDFLPLGREPRAEAAAANGGAGDASLLKEARAQLEAYFQGELRAFDLPLRQPGTLFQDSVWRALAQVPFGHTVTYAELARLCGHPDAARAVGSALNKNRLPILVPCHRVLAAGGLGGFAGGREWKLALLGREGVALPLGGQP